MSLPAEVAAKVAAGWNDPQPGVTLLAEEDRGGAHHFRFRAEAPGEVVLRFGDLTVTVRIAPEQLA